jgi:hypothetical protein
MADCPKVRAMLATPEGDILPAWVESHLWACEGCQGFRAEVEEQRALLGSPPGRALGRT